MDYENDYMDSRYIQSRQNKLILEYDEESNNFNVLNSEGKVIGMVDESVHEPSEAYSSIQEMIKNKDVHFSNSYDERERVIEYLSRIKKMNQQQKQEEKKVEFKENGFISVSVGDGLTDLFHELGVDEVIEGGQTMNPSTEDVLSAIEKIPAKNIYILPNNGNIILAAEQAKDLTKDKAVHVIPTKNIPQGIAAMINFVEGFTPEQNEEAMTEALSEVKSGQVTYAVRDTVIDGKEIKAGNIMGLSDKTIEVVGTDVVDTTIDLLKKMMDEESELITVYYGEEGTKEDAEKIAKAIEEIDDEMEVEIQYGGQPIYYYFVSIE